MKILSEFYKKRSKEFENWTLSCHFRIMFFNLILLFLFLLRSAGYFHPYFVISVNFIVLVGIILTIILLHAGSKIIFLISLSFWIFAAFLEVVKINIWAERTAIYAYQSLVLGVVLLIFESAFLNIKRRFW